LSEVAQGEVETLSMFTRKVWLGIRK